MDTQNKPNAQVQKKYNHRGEDTEEVVKNVNAGLVIPKNAKPPDWDNPEFKLKRRASRQVQIYHRGEDSVGVVQKRLCK